MMIRRLTTIVLSCFAASAVVRAQAPLRTDSQSRFVHRIELVDEKGETVKADSKEPYSPRKTCGKCHDYKAISGGYHFHAGSAGQAGGRPGEPWFLADPTSRVQLPVSYRPWADAAGLAPGKLGITSFRFAEVFGAHLPGGGIFEADAAGKPLNEVVAEKPDLATTEGSPYFGSRWNLSGSLQIDCLLCHLATPVSGSARADELKSLNFRWAPIATAGFGTVVGQASKAAAPGQSQGPVDPEVAAQQLQQGGTPGAAQAQVETKYQPTIFNLDGTVTLDVRRRAADTNCLFCHYTRALESHGKKTWHHDGDVHMEQGLTCTACHANDIRHQIARGDGSPEDIARDAGNAERSCEGCHAAGGLGAPIAKHEGLPKVHLEKITCTACHSGPMPRKEPYQTQTSIAHGLGLPTEEPIEERAVPAIYSPAFKRHEKTGKIGVYRYAYPVWWGVKGEKDAITLLPLERIKLAFAQAPDVSTDAGILAAIGTLAEALKGTPQADAPPVYIKGGKVFEKAGDKLTSRMHKIAEGVFWPIAHDVRPVGQSLGAKSCADCHSTDSAFFFGNVIRDPLAAGGEKGSEPEATTTQPAGGHSATTQPTAKAGSRSDDWIGGAVSAGTNREPGFGEPGPRGTEENRWANPRSTAEPPTLPEWSAPVPFGGNAAMARMASILAAVSVTAAPTQPSGATQPGKPTPSSALSAQHPSAAAAADAGTGPLPMHELTGHTKYLAEIGRFVEAKEGECFVCHAYKKLAWMDQQAGLEISYVDAEQFKHTVHKDVQCLGCHASIKRIPHGAGPHRVDCAATCHGIKDAKTGGPYSHASIAKEFAASVHGVHADDTAKEREAKPACTYCHMNEIHPPPEGRPPGMQIVHLCSTCHADEEMMKAAGISPELPHGFREQFHYKAMARGDNGMATCTDCHTTHSIRPKEDPQSTVNQANLVKTCGGGQANGCHPNANIHFANTAFHMPVRLRSDPVEKYTDRMFTWLTISVMALLILHILLTLYGHYVTEPRRARGHHA